MPSSTSTATNGGKDHYLVPGEQGQNKKVTHGSWVLPTVLGYQVPHKHWPGENAGPPSGTVICIAEGSGQTKAEGRQSTQYSTHVHRPVLSFVAPQNDNRPETSQYMYTAIIQDGVRISHPILH